MTKVEDNYSFTKEEKLCSRAVIDKLFGIRKAPFVYPFKIAFSFEENDQSTDQYPCKVLFSVPKRNFKRAVHRNLLRRRMREAFRLNNHEFYQKLRENGKKISAVFIYIEKKELEYATIENGMKHAFAKMEKAMLNS